MSTLLLKLILTPALIGAVSLAGRRWGSGVSGWLVGLPMTSGPVALYLALDQGPAFAAQAASGVLIGVASGAAFCLTYSRLALRLSWPLSAVASVAVFLAAIALLRQISIAPIPLFACVVAILVVALWVMPRAVAYIGGNSPPWWDLPARMAVATLFVMALTTGAPLLGPRVSGLLAPFPIFATVLAVFAHRYDGAAAVARLMRGVVLGLFAFAGFFVIIALLIEHVGIAGAFSIATILALLIQGASLWVLRGGASGRARRVA